MTEDGIGCAGSGEELWGGHQATSKLKQALSNSARGQLFIVVVYWWQAIDLIPLIKGNKGRLAGNERDS